MAPFGPLVKAAKHTVFLRTNWADEWTEVPYLYCNFATFALAPSMPQAQLSWDYGRIIRPDATSYATVQPLDPIVAVPVADIDRAYVRIEIENLRTPEEPIVWHGRIQEIADTQFGNLFDGSTAGIRTGRQTLIALGLENELARNAISQSAIDDIGPDGNPLVIGRAIAFNAGIGDRATDSFDIRPNKAVNALKFSADLTTSAPVAWDAEDMVNYLLANFAPRTALNNVAITYYLAGQPVDWLQWQKPALEVQGRTIADILNQLCDRRRLLTWRCQVMADDRVAVEVITLADQDITLPSGPVLPRNPNRAQMDFSDAVNILDAQIVRSGVHKYDQVIGIGARRTSTFNANWWVQYDDAEEILRRGYSVELADEYSSGAMADPDYANADREQQQRMNADFRGSDKFLACFRHFTVREDWDGKIENGSYPVTPVNPILDDGQLPALADREVSPFWLPGMRFLTELPLLVGHDYSADNIETGQTGGVAGAANRQTAIIAKIETTPDGQQQKTYRYAYGDKIADENQSESEDDAGRSYSLSVAPLKKKSGFEVRVSGGPQHKIDDNWFQPIAANGNDPSVDDKLADPKFAGFLTICCWETDDYAEVRVPWDISVDPAATTLDAVKILRIEFGDKYRQDYVVPGSVVDVDDAGQLVRSVSGGFVVDRTPLMLDVCTIAKAWYSRTRQALRLNYATCLPPTNSEIGWLVTQIVSNGAIVSELNSVITEFTYDLQNQQVTIQTDYAEFDPRGFF